MNYKQKYERCVKYNNALKKMHGGADVINADFETFDLNYHTRVINPFDDELNRQINELEQNIKNCDDEINLQNTKLAQNTIDANNQLQIVQSKMIKLNENSNNGQIVFSLKTIIANAQKELTQLQNYREEMNNALINANEQKNNYTKQCDVLKLKQRNFRIVLLDYQDNQQVMNEAHGL